MRGSLRRPELWALVGILGLAAALRYTGITQGFPQDYHWDERIYFHEALYGLANGLRRESTVSANLPYLLMPVLLLGGLVGGLQGMIRGFDDLVRAYIAHPAPFLLLGRAVWAASGVLSVAATYRIGRRLGGPGVGLPAAFFLAGTFLHVEQSHFIKNDVPASLWLLLATDALFNILERGARRDYAWAGFWIGLATATKYFCAAAALAILLAHLLRRDGDAAAGVLARLRTLPILPPILAAFVGFAGTTPVLLTDPANLWANVLGELGARFGSIPTGDLPQWAFYISEHLMNGLGGLLLGLGLAGGLIVAARSSPKGILLLAVPILFFVAVNLRPNNFARYIVPAVPFLCISAALTLRTTVGTFLSPTLMRLRALAQESGDPRLRMLTGGRALRRAGPLLLVVGALLVGGPTWLDSIRYARLALAPDTRNAAQAWFETRVPPGARVLIEGGESFERTSNLGPQLWLSAPLLEARGPNEPRERFFWVQLLDVVRQAPAYALVLPGAFARTTREENGQRVAAPVESVAEYDHPDYLVLLNWRSADLRPGSPAPLWQSLTAEYILAATFPCHPCFPEDYYAWRMDYPTLRTIPLTGGDPLASGPEVRVFQRKTTAYPPAAP